MYYFLASFTALENFFTNLKILLLIFLSIFLSTSFTIALPTTTPSAYLDTIFAFSGVLIPKPTTIGIFVYFLSL